MSLVVFKYCLPLALGYCVFTALSGSLRPWVRPNTPSDRPAWLLGLWQGSVIALALATLSHVAWQSPLYEVLGHLKPLIGTTLLTMLIGGVVALAYRQNVGPTAQPESPGVAVSEAMVENQGQEQRISGDMTRPIAQCSADEAIEPDVQDVAGIDMHDFLARETQTLALADCEDPSMADLRSELHAETSLRVETEKHLRITRKALHVLESQARDYEAARTDAMIGLEEELVSQVRHSASAESRLQRELEKVATLEITIIDMKQELLESKRSLRQGMQARAKALTTAHKALAHARRSLQGRSRMEARISAMAAALTNRQQTITSLIKTLENEKSRSDAQIDERARQLIMHQRQLRARRAVEDAASTASGKSGSRLIKRIAKARRIEGSAN